MSDQRKLPEAEEQGPAALLPWYLNDSLSQSERAEVEAALAQDPALRAELESLRLFGETLREDSDAIAVPAGDFDAVMARIDGSGESQSQQRAAPAQPGSQLSLWTSLGRLFAPPAIRFAAIAAALVIMVQGGAIIGLLQDDSAGQAGYQVATEGAPAGQAEGPRVIVIFQAGAALAEVGKLLAAQELRIVDGPSAEGAYVLQGKAGTESESDDLVRRLQESAELVSFAGKAS